MADVVVNFLQQQLAQLIEEASFDSGVVEDEVKSFQRELERINIFLDNSDGKRSDHENVKALVRQITEVAYEAEHVIDTFIVEVEEHKKRNLLGKIIYRIGHAKMLRTVAKKIEGLNREINKIYDDIEKYGIERDEVRVDAEVLALHRRRRYVEEDDVVGFRDDCNTLVGQLIQTQNSNLDVISIIGMGGLGKTTLARKIYNDDRIKSHFHCLVWVYVSEDFKIRESFFEILKSQLSIPSLDELIKELKEKSEEHAKKVLQKELLKCLQGKKYLVVMDDIWKTQDWNEVKNAFPDNSNGSRILITSRIKEVASCASFTSPYILPYLNKDESWELFHKKVFRGGGCPPELETLGRQIAEGCHGLPLSIVVLGGLLANKEKTNRTWSKVIADINWYLTECKDILALSYTHLPRRVKPCFLYFGAYPEDFKIPVRELLKLWIAEGFIQHTGERNNEDVAEDYLEELIDRNLIQMATRRSDGGVKHCRIHDLLRDLCISKSAEEKFLYLPRDYNPSSRNTSRRLSIRSRILPQFISSNTSGTSYVRSFLSFGGESVVKFEEIHWKWVYRNLKMLRVLHLELDAIFIPEEIQILIHLRYLKIRLTAYKLPTSIGNLTNLETLAICHVDGIGHLPDSIMKLPCLRNLCSNLRLPKPLVTAPGNLQVLSVKTLYLKDIEHLIVEGKLPNIRKLRLLRDTSGMQNIDGWDIEGILASAHYLSHLQTLKISYFYGKHIISLSNSFPETITKISLVGVGFDDSGMEVLGKLPKLWILKLENCLSSCGLHIHAHSFPQLQFLKLVGERIKTWKQGKGAMPGLRHLVIDECLDLTMIRSELKSLTALREVELSGIKSCLANTFKKLQLELGFKLTLENILIETEMDFLSSTVHYDVQA